MILPIRRALLLTVAWLTFAAGALAACGQMGPLTLPSEAADDSADEDRDDSEDER